MNRVALPQGLAQFLKQFDKLLRRGGKQLAWALLGLWTGMWQRPTLRLDAMRDRSALAREFVVPS
jgi:hypothetical protein